MMVKPTVVLMGIYLVELTVDYLVAKSVARLEQWMVYLRVNLSVPMMGQQMVWRWDLCLVGKLGLQRVV